MSLLLRFLLFLAILRQVTLAASEDVFSQASTSTYTWSTQTVGETAQLVTLWCRFCEQAGDRQFDVPLLSVLRDTLGDFSPENDRLTYLWLYTAKHPTLRQHLLSAVPFFYWHIDEDSAVEAGYPEPLLNVSAPLYPVLMEAGRSVVQWAAFDPLSAWVRASSRSFRANQADNLRLRLEEAIDCLNAAPPALTGSSDSERGANSEGLSQHEIDFLVGRLGGRRSMQGGLIKARFISKVGQDTRFKRERIRSRNAELLRLLAEKTGLYFEILNLADRTGDFAILWFASGSAQPSSGTTSKPLWKVLNIKDPWSDRSLTRWRGPSVHRAFDDDGKLLSPSEKSTHTATLIPLAIYSLGYPRMPLLLVDFRDKSRARRYEMAQRAITELTAGVLGLSHFTNWYYYAGLLFYQTIWARRGIAANQNERIDSYSDFRLRLALDHQLDPQLREEVLHRAGSLIVNPLDSDPVRNISYARQQYARLMRATAEGDLVARLNRDRRAEVAAFDESAKASLMENGLQLLTLGRYTRRVAESEENLARLDLDRRFQSQLDFLDSVIENGTDPGVAFSNTQIEKSIRELQGLRGGVKAESVRRHLETTLVNLQRLRTSDEQFANVDRLGVQLGNNGPAGTVVFPVQ